MHHGGHVPADEVDTRQVTGDQGVAALDAPPVGTPFGYLFPELEDKPDSHLPGDPATVVANLNALGAAMVPDPTADPPPDTGNSTIPPIYTYWGQFVDHDLTANTDRDSTTSDITRPDLAPLAPENVVQNLRNLRRPNLDLDSVYGGGPSFCDDRSPDAALYDGPRMRLGHNHEAGIVGEKIPPVDDLERDLPRIGPLLDDGVITMDVLPESLQADPNVRTRPLIGDLRNDENLLVSQIHTAVLRFHNAVLKRIDTDPVALGLQPGSHEAVRFERARQLTRWHYQWLVVHDYLRTVTTSGVVDKVLLGGAKHYRPGPGQPLFMPLEHSVAAFRFGHSMVRGSYDHNRNFGERHPGQGVGPPLIPSAPFGLLFEFTGNGFSLDPSDPTKSVRNPFRGAPTLPFNWIIEFDRFTNKGDADPTHFARRIDTQLSPPLGGLVNEGTSADVQDAGHAAIRGLLRHLARRNLLRGYLLSIPTGQAVAALLGVPALTDDELRAGNPPAVNSALDDGGFLLNTPLWYYVLKEAEVRANGNSLGEVGSRIVCETIIGLLRNDPDSYLSRNGGWDPSQGVALPNGDPIVTIRDFLSFTGVPV
ncbi:MAG: heme peroxidase family protein [Acidimicrobiales bacterium]